MYNDNREKLNSKLPSDGFTANEYVAVAYDNWYPGHVESIYDGCHATVNFLTRCEKPGQFMWPSSKDKQKVDFRFVLEKGFIPNCENSGWLW